MIHVGVGGVWRRATGTHVGVNGVWRQSLTSFVGVNGVWRAVPIDPAIALFRLVWTTGNPTSNGASNSGTAPVRITGEMFAVSPSGVARRIADDEMPLIRIAGRTTASPAITSTVNVLGPRIPGGFSGSAVSLRTVLVNSSAPSGTAASVSLELTSITFNGVGVQLESVSA